jgi:EAL domain-containing protein (putative c-di-GMP-specific phosphodiesterase class I)
VSYVKIEGSYIRNIEVDERNRLLVSHIHQIVSKMGIKTIASFIEDRETGEILKGLGINYGVGIHFGTPRDI